MHHRYIGDKAFYRRVFGVAVPIIIQNGITNFVSLLDNIMVGQVGTVPMSGVSIVNGLLFVFNLCVFGASSGAGIFTAQFYGSKDDEGIRHTFRFKFLICIVISLVGAAIFMLGGSSLIGLYLTGEGDAATAAGALDHGLKYLAIMLWGFLPFALTNTYSSTLRETGETFIPMLGGIAAVFVNLVLNYILIFGKFGAPEMGVEGAAIATLLSRVAEFAVCLFCALRSRVIPLDLKALLRPGWEMLRRFVKYASPVMANELFWGLGNSLLTVILGHMTISVEFLAANAVMGNLNRLFLVVCFGLGAATAVMIGKAIGEGQSHDELMDLSRTLSWVTILVGAALAVIALALVPLLFQPVIFPLFKLYDLSAHLATTLAVTGFACIPFHAYSISAVTGILRAGGDVFWSTALDLGPQWLVALPLTALLALVLDTDPWFVSLAIQAESFIKCPICLWRIRSRKWIHDVTLPEGER